MHPVPCLLLRSDGGAVLFMFSYVSIACYLAYCFAPSTRPPARISLGLVICVVVIVWVLT